MHNRRDFLRNLKIFCTYYGIQSVLGQHSFAQSSSPKRLVNFIVKYTGGTTSKNDEGLWDFNNSLKPLSNYKDRMTTVLGLDAKFNAPMNNHSAPQISALSGSMSGFTQIGNGYYSKGGLRQFSSGEGKSIDVLVGEKLQKDYGTKLPYLLIGNNSNQGKNIDYGTSSWGDLGKILPSVTKINDLQNLISHHLTCKEQNSSIVDSKLNAIKYLEKNNKIFESSYLIDKVNFSKVKENLEKIKLSNSANQAGASCIESASKVVYSDIIGSKNDKDLLTKKMNIMFEMAITALKFNLTRSITFNLHNTEVHTVSHFGNNTEMLNQYVAWSTYYNGLIANFVKRLDAENLLNDSLVYCNAGASMEANVHNSSNLSTFIINGGKGGIVGNPADPKPVGSLLADILNKFGLSYSQYGGTNHKYGVGKPQGYV